MKLLKFLVISVISLLASPVFGEDNKFDPVMCWAYGQNSQNCLANPDCQWCTQSGISAFCAPPGVENCVNLSNQEFAQISDYHNLDANRQCLMVGAKALYDQRANEIYTGDVNKRWDGIFDNIHPPSAPKYSDCSSAVSWIYWTCFGSGPDFINGQQWNDGYTGTLDQHGTKISLSQAQPGDLVFYGNPIDHVAIYIGSDRVISHGSDPVCNCPVNYRSDMAEVRTYLSTSDFVSQVNCYKLDQEKCLEHPKECIYVGCSYGCPGCIFRNETEVGGLLSCAGKFAEIFTCGDSVSCLAKKLGGFISGCESYICPKLSSGLMKWSPICQIYCQHHHCKGYLESDESDEGMDIVVLSDNNEQVEGGLSCAVKFAEIFTCADDIPCVIKKVGSFIGGCESYICPKLSYFLIQYSPLCQYYCRHHHCKAYLGELSQSYINCWGLNEQECLTHPGVCVWFGVPKDLGWFMGCINMNIPDKTIIDDSNLLGSIQSSIQHSTSDYWGRSTSAGPDGGVEACAWAVNNIISNAGYRKVGDNPDYVPSVVAAIKAGRGRQIQASQAVPGDLVVACGEQHIGVCMEDHCNTIDSNSSSRRCFCWRSGFNFDNYFNCGQATYWRIEN
jgi:cell wall-associated NlpC family hydrolase